MAASGARDRAADCAERLSAGSTWKIERTLSQRLAHWARWFTRPDTIRDYDAFVRERAAVDLRTTWGLTPVALVIECSIPVVKKVARQPLFVVAGELETVALAHHPECDVANTGQEFSHE